MIQFEIGRRECLVFPNGRTGFRLFDSEYAWLLLQGTRILTLATVQHRYR